MIGIPHPKWTERPLLIVVRSKGSKVTKEEVLNFLQVSTPALSPKLDTLSAAQRHFADLCAEVLVCKTVPFKNCR